MFRKILETYNGVFLSDVVGLGKTFITALLLQQLQGGILVVCPPVLLGYWEKSLWDFGVQRFEVQSLGKLDIILRKDTSKYKYVVVDDIFAQLKLFQIPKASTIPGIPDLEKFFNKLKKTLNEAKQKITDS